MSPKPYLREVSLKRDQIKDYDTYPFSIAAVRELRTLQISTGSRREVRQSAFPSPSTLMRMR